MDKKTVLITGASKGLGRCLVQEFSDNDYNTIISGRDKEELESLAEEVRKKGHCYIMEGDICEDRTIEKLRRLADFKNLDVFINNAGIYENSPFLETKQEDLERIMKINFIAPYILTQRILPIFLKKKQGLIININSVAGIRGSENESIYSASKHALKGFSDSLKYEVIKKGVKILDVYLGAMATQMIKDRKNPELCIQPEEAAKVIFSLSRDYPSLSINEIHIGRRKYN